VFYKPVFYKPSRRFGKTWRAETRYGSARERDAHLFAPPRVAVLTT